MRGSIVAALAVLINLFSFCEANAKDYTVSGKLKVDTITVQDSMSLNLTISNNTDSTILMYADIISDNLFVTGWDYQIFGATAFFRAGQEPARETFTMPGRGHSRARITYSLDILHFKNMTQTGHFKLRIYEQGNESQADTFSVKINRVVTGISESSSIDKDINVYPIPSHDAVTIASGNKNFSIAGAAIYSINGQLLLQQEFDQADQHVLDISSLPKGIYILLLKDRSGKTINKMISRL